MSEINSLEIIDEEILKKLKKKEHNKKWYNKNKEIMKQKMCEYSKVYYNKIKNESDGILLEKKYKRSINYYETNKETILAKARERRLKNSLKI